MQQTDRSKTRGTNQKTHELFLLKQTLPPDCSILLTFRPKFWLILEFWKWNGKDQPVKEDYLWRWKDQPLFPENFLIYRSVPFIFRPKLQEILTSWKTSGKEDVRLKKWINKLLNISKAIFFSFSVECVFWYWVGRSDWKKKTKTKSQEVSE